MTAAVKSWSFYALGALVLRDNLNAQWVAIACPGLEFNWNAQIQRWSCYWGLLLLVISTERGCHPVSLDLAARHSTLPASGTRQEPWSFIALTGRAIWWCSCFQITSPTQCHKAFLDRNCVSGGGAPIRDPWWDDERWNMILIRQAHHEGKRRHCDRDAVNWNSHANVQNNKYNLFFLIWISNAQHPISRPPNELIEWAT